jgi:uncharacterized membrane protein YvlD (DUF360 family)
VTGLRPVFRLLLVWVVAALTLLLTNWVLPGFHIEDAASAFAAAALLGLLNALVWPVLVRLVLPLTVLTLGLAPLALNAAMVAFVAWALDGVTLDGFWWGVAVTVAVTAVSMAVTALLALDDDTVVLRHLMGSRRSRSSGDVPGDERPPGVIFLQIDGLALPVLQRAVRDGNAPTIAGWLRDGTHHLAPWTTGWSSQTGVSQAGILLGSHADMPAFRWYEKDTGRTFVSNRPRHAAELERRLSTGSGLLHADGASRGNIFTGDAADAVLTMASAGRKRGRIGAGYYAYFSKPYTTMRTLLGVLVEVVREVQQAGAQRRRDVRPRVHRGGVYPLLRAFTTVLTRDVIVATLIGDMNAGRSVVYADFVGYDEVAHHSGVERYDALETLRRLDHELARLVRAAEQVARPYRFVVLSDHGQSQGATFRTRYGCTLAELVGTACRRHASDSGEQRPSAAGKESWGYAGGALTEIAAGPGLAAKVAGRATRGRRRAEGGDVVIGPEAGPEPGSTGSTGSSDSAGGDDVIVLASGNLGLVYLTHDPRRLTREQIDERYPELIPTLRDHPGIGFLLVATEERGSVVLGADGELELATGVVRGDDPLAPFGEAARTQVSRTDAYPHCADLMVNSLWEPATGEVAAFEELVGSHGGLGGDQTHPFLLYPADLPPPEEHLVDAEEVHAQLRRWLAHLGHEAFAEVPSRRVEPSA